jgi:hypothetical protein
MLKISFKKNIRYCFLHCGCTKINICVVPTEITVDKALMKLEQIRADSALVDPVEVERLYSELLTKYVHRWGAVSGTDLLRSEISAYIRQGFSFPEAVKRIHARTNRPS